MPPSQPPPSSDLAVLTGDIIRSCRLTPEALDAAMAALSRAAAAMSAWDGSRDARFSRFRGDGWQCLAPSPALGLRAVLFLRAHLRALDRDTDTRASVGIGPGALPERGDLSAAGGPAFEISGRGLDKMARVQQLAVAAEPAEAGIARAVPGRHRLRAAGERAHCRIEDFRGAPGRAYDIAGQDREIRLLRLPLRLRRGHAGDHARPVGQAARLT